MATPKKRSARGADTPDVVTVVPDDALVGNAVSAFDVTEPAPPAPTAVPPDAPRPRVSSGFPGK